MAAPEADAGGDPEVELLVAAGKDSLALMRQRVEQGEARLRDFERDGATDRRARDFEHALERLAQTVRAAESGPRARRAASDAAREFDAALAALDGEPTS